MAFLFHLGIPPEDMLHPACGGGVQRLVVVTALRPPHVLLTTCPQARNESSCILRPQWGQKKADGHYDFSSDRRRSVTTVLTVLYVFGQFRPSLLCLLAIKCSLHRNQLECRFFSKHRQYQQDVFPCPICEGGSPPSLYECVWGTYVMSLLLNTTFDCLI